jgi:hypothetical protein
MPKTIIAVLVGSMFFAFGSSVGADELRKTVSLNTGTPDVKTLERALFPEEIVQKQKECEELEKKGFACQSVIPKASVETTQVTFARGSANLTESSKEFLRALAKHSRTSRGLIRRWWWKDIPTPPVLKTSTVTFPRNAPIP